MRKINKDLKDKALAELQKEANVLYQEIAKLQLELKVNPVKDTNQLAKKRQRLAVILTLVQEKKNLETVKRLVK
jgi:ribosomal protein L29